MEHKRLIVAGIGTEIGKTICSAILCQALGADYWKPVQSGELDNSDSMKIAALVDHPAVSIHRESYRLTEPMSPHAAARIDQVTVDLHTLNIPETENKLIIELAGGLMVPLNDQSLNIDWIEKLKIPVVLVSQYYLGNINHTILSWEALKSRKIPVAGIVFNGPKNEETFSFILQYTKEKCLLEIDHEGEITNETIKKYADRIQL